MISEVKQFIEDNIDLIDQNDFDTLYIKADFAREGFMTPASVTRELLDAGIDPMEYLTFVPSEYMYQFSDITKVPWPTRRFDLIKTRAFGYCKNITEVIIPEGVMMIGSMAFAGCAKLTKLHLPKSLVSLGHTAFFGTAIEEITYAGTVAQWQAVEQNPNWLSKARAATLHVHCLDGDVKPEA